MEIQKDIARAQVDYSVIFESYSGNRVMLCPTCTEKWGKQMLPQLIKESKKWNSEVQGG
jgi:hypothetical protein